MALAHILIVEDERIVARDLSIRLQRLGHEVAGIVASGEAAIEHVANAETDLIFMDIRLEGALDGIETAERIQANHKVPIVFMTAHSDSGTRERAERTNPHGFLVKPFNDGELNGVIGSAVPAQCRAWPGVNLRALLAALAGVPARWDNYAGFVGNVVKRT